jgi:SAM-dependent methyltransferase
MTKEEERALIHDRLNTYESVVRERIKQVRRGIDKGCYDDGGHNAWLEQFAEGKGLDVCCGHIPIKGAIGIDSSWFQRSSRSGGLGPLCHLRIDGDNLASYEALELDFVVSNYLEGFPSPLKVLNEWYRVLKKGGTVALIVRNSEKYNNRLGPFENRNRSSIFTPTTIKFYLRKAKFVEVEIIEMDDALRVKARKQ